MMQMNASSCINTYWTVLYGKGTTISISFITNVKKKKLLITGVVKQKKG
uniref:Uncharacterized protein n=1 Tax=Arundo donax TaxID=35708 RepID=A0A0A9FMP4_ARUDO